jgi:hypothetical protein
MDYAKNNWKIYNLNNQVVLQNLTLENLKKLAKGLDAKKYYAKQAGSEKEIALWQL